MEQKDAQILFFQHIKGMLPPHISYVDAIAQVLNISNDSAYRRIRSEKPIALEEIKKLCIHFKISLDQFLHLNSDSVVFTGKLTDVHNFDFDAYLHEVLRNLQIIETFEENELLILPKDVPIFHHYNFPELAAFKYFFWMKTILNYPEYSKTTFDPSKMAESLMITGEKILASYNRIPSTEIWNVDNITTTLRQIEYYWESKVFTSEDDVLKIFDCLERSMEHVELQAEAGHKINQPGKGDNKGAPLNIYINDFIVGDSTHIPVLNGHKIIYLVHCHLNFIQTKDVGFANYTYNFFQNVLHKSTLISVVSEKDRRRFFNRIREKIYKRKEALLRRPVVYMRS